MRQQHNEHAPNDQSGRLEQMRTAAGTGPLLILTHNNPDPDALASGKALVFLFKHAWGISAQMAYSGRVTGGENMAMLRLLAPEWQPLEAVGGWGRFSSIAMVDTQPGAGNNHLPLDIIPQIVIDHHHPLRSGLEKVRHVDIQTEVGATVSIVYRYLEAAARQVLDLVERTDRCAQALQAHSPERVLCHSDLHAGNVLIAADGSFYLVDWDAPILAPKERDLMYAGGGQFGGTRTPQQEEGLFYQGYGQVQIDHNALAYYRYERIVEDFAVYCEQLLLSNEGGSDREQSLRYLMSNFESNGTIAIAYQADQARHKR